MNAIHNHAFMKRTLARIVGAAAAVLWLVAADGCAVRNPEMYRDDVRKLLQTKGGILQSCYEAELRVHPNANGKVVAHFIVERESGRVIEVQIDDIASTPDRTLRGCVLEALKELVLYPPDSRHGAATFTWEFHQARE